MPSARSLSTILAWLPVGGVGRWVFAEVERDLISGAHPRGALPGARSSVRKLSGRPKGLPGASSRLEGQLHEHPRAQAEPLPCISARMWSIPLSDRRRSAGSRRGPGPSVPRPGSARRRGGPGSAPRPPPSTRSRELAPGRGARRGRRPTTRPRPAGRRARRRGGGGPRSTPGGCSG